MKVSSQQAKDTTEAQRVGLRTAEAGPAVPFRALAQNLETLATYRDVIGRVPMLTAADERALAADIARARRASAALPPSVVEPARDVRDAIRAGIDARHRLVTSNLAWVITLAKRSSRPSVSFDDLLQSGATGLMVAAETFDPDLGRFTTHATFAVQDEIRATLEDSSPGLRVRLGVRREAAIIAVARERLRVETGREPSIEQLAAAIGIEPEAVARVIPVTEMPTSIYTLPSELALSDPRAEVEAVVLARARSTAARKLLGELPDRESEIVSLRFGLADGTERNRAEVGRMLEISRERVRQIEKRALGILRAAADTHGITDLIT